MSKEKVDKNDKNERRWILNKKAFAALRALNETYGAKDTEKWSYIHVSPKGVTATDTSSFIRVTLPKDREKDQPSEPRIFSYDEAMALIPKKDMDVVMPEGMEAKTSGAYIVPNYEMAIPEPKDQTATLTVNAKFLINMLKAACDVTNHSRSLVRLRFYGNRIRIDAHKDNGGQEFMGVLLGTNYNGICIPGDVPEGTATQKAPVNDETNDQQKLKLPILEGRRFRDA